LDINNGVCLQYGVIGSVGASLVTVTLPQSYTTLYRVVGNVCGPTMYNEYGIYFNLNTLSIFSCVNRGYDGSSINLPLNYISIGY